MLYREGEICLTLVIEEDEPRDPVEMVFRLLFRAAFEGVTVPRLETGLTVLRIGAAGELNRVDEPPRLWVFERLWFWRGIASQEVP